jgi:hypothetical protein
MDQVCTALSSFLYDVLYWHSAYSNYVLQVGSIHCVLLLLLAT